MSCEYCGIAHPREALCQPRKRTLSRRWFLGALPALVAGTAALPTLLPDLGDLANPLNHRNTLLTDEIITREALIILERHLSLQAAATRRQYDTSFILVGRRGGKQTSLLAELEALAEQGKDGILYLPDGRAHTFPAVHYSPSFEDLYVSPNPLDADEAEYWYDPIKVTRGRG